MSSHKSTRWRSLWVAGYALLLLVVVWSLFAARRWALAEMATTKSVGDWQAWRDDVRQQNETSPVRRRVPASAEPPALVLLRDYFNVSLAGGVLFSSVLYWVMVWFIQGAIRDPRAAVQAE
jgi:hypothetical protein